VTGPGRLGAWIAVGAIVLGLALVLTAAPVRAASDPSTGQWFVYQDNTYLNNGWGNYSGYSEQETSQYRYDVQSVNGPTIAMYGSGSWSWSNSSGTTQTGSWSEDFSFSDLTRQYVSGFDVLGTYTNPYVWFWVPPSLQVGQVVPVLDENLTVTSLSSTVWLQNFPPTPRVGEELQGTGSYLRNDIYGQFAASYTDQYWFDPATGFVIAEYYNEQDSAAVGGFQWQEQVFTTSASFPIAFDVVQLLGAYVGIPLIPIAIFLVIYVHRDGPRRVKGTVPSTGRTVARRLRRVGRLGASTMPAGTSYAPFVRTSVRRALGLRDPVYLATAGTTVHGIYTYDRNDRIGSIVATDPAVVRTFLSMRKAPNCFVELPAGTPNVLPSPARMAGSFDVYELAPVVPVTYDAELIRPMLPADLPAVLAITQRAYTQPQPRQLVEGIADGDLILLAVIDGVPVGFAAATFGDDGALLYGLTVSEQARGQGLATALLAARLSALAAMGVPKARMEIMEGNAAPRHLAARFGFQKVGSMVYYNLRPAKAVPVSDRRPAA
jgi:ribosomal protein S18 acetylase RimI-like enzyme